MEIQVTVRLYASLNDFLPPPRRQASVDVSCAERTTVKDLLERLGVPHTEVDLLLVDGEPVGFEHHVQAGDRVAAYPRFHSIDVEPVTRVRPRLLDAVRFVLDGHLGRLAAFLRLAGFDTAYLRDADDPELALASAREHRILLTRDVGLLKRGLVTHGYWMRETAPPRQLAEVFERFGLQPLARPFTRCMRCNGRLRAVSKDRVAGLVPPRSYELHEDFLRCDDCERVYWRGTHYARLVKLLDGLVDGET